MAEKNIAAFIRDDAKTVGVKFFKSGNQNQHYTDQDFLSDLSPTTYTYVTNLDLELNDLVVVLATGKPSVVQVVRIDDGVCIEPNNEIKYRWVICKVETDAFEKLSKENDEIETCIAKAYKKNVKRQFRDVVMMGLDDSSRERIMALTSKGESK